MTDIVNIPDLLPISQYPALGSVNFNQEAYDYATSVPPAVARMREIAVACRTCAIAAREQADAAMSYRNQAANSAAASEASKAIAQAAASSAEAFKGQAQSAAASAAASAQAVDQYMLGPKTVPPTMDNQGGAIKLGAMYINVGTDPNLNNRWFWWGGAVLRWVPGVGDLPATFVPRGGGIFTGHIEVPQGAAGNQAPRASEVFLKAPATNDKTQLMGNLQVGFALLTTVTGRGGDWPAETYDANIQAWLVETTGSVGRAKQVATQIFASDGQRIQGSTWQRVLHDTTWQAWDRVITARTAMDQQVTANVAAGTTSYTLDPALGGSHVVSINGTCTFNLPAGRQYGDQVALDVISVGGVRSIGFSANVVLPKDGTGAQLPFPTYVAGNVVSFLFRCILVNRWECYYAGVH